MKNSLIAVVLVLCIAAMLTSCGSTQGATTALPDPTQVPSPVATAVPIPDPTPTPIPTPTPDPTLKAGVESDAVLQLQQRLAELGYLNLSEYTTRYGPATQRAVQLFQTQNGLAADGIAGVDTLVSIYDENASKCVLPLAGYVIGLDPGHQAQGNSGQEPVAPGSGETKPKVSSGTAGASTGVDEYVVTLKVALKLRDLLEEQGATVVMTRETNDVDISNSERATKMNDVGADLVLRMHCDGVDDPSPHGAFILVPEGSHTEGIQKQSRAAAEAILPAFIAATGANDRGISERSDQTGFNWSTVPVCNIEMGFMSNAAEDERLVTDEYQSKCAQGLRDGIVDYFANL